MDIIIDCRLQDAPRLANRLAFRRELQQEEYFCWPGFVEDTCYQK